jgi:mannose-6-phosphate isomerase-like protein (cupin superfamily)
VIGCRKNKTDKAQTKPTRATLGWDFPKTDFIGEQPWEEVMTADVSIFKAVRVAADNDRFGGGLFFLNGRFDCKLSAKETNGDLCIYDTMRTEKGGPPLHYHHIQDEWFFVREGEFLFQIGENMFRLEAGDSIFAPRKVPHAFANVSDTGKLMIAYQPAGTIEQFFLDASRLTNPSPPDMQRLFRANGMEIVGPAIRLD